MPKHNKKSNKKKRISLIICIIALVISICLLGKYFYDKYRVSNLDSLLDTLEIDKSQITNQRTERILQIEALQKKNPEVIGWIQIDGTSINYPVLQTTDNSYYMNHDYKKEYNSEGSAFLDKDYNFELPSTNLLIYGHNNRDGSGMFHQLLEYEDESFYKEHPKIRFTTNSSDSQYEVIAVFKSRVYYKSEKDVFRYYYFVTAENEAEFNEYIENSKEASLYDTGKTAIYGDELLTLSTCAFYTEDGRFAIVAKKVIE